MPSSAPAQLPSRIRRRRRADGSVIREGRLLSIMGAEWDGYVYLSDVYISAAQFLAVKHFNERSGAVMPELPALLEGCDFQMTFEQRETSYSPVDAVQALLDATEDPADPVIDHQWNSHNNHHNSPLEGSDSSSTTFTIIHEGEIVGSHINHTHAMDGRRRRRQLEQDSPDNRSPDDDEELPLASPDEWQHPFAVVGASYSYVTIPLNIVGASTMELPMLSGSATSSALDGAPLFGRTIPTNRGDSHAAMLYYRHRNITHVACLYSTDAWGTAYHADLQREARHFNITLQSVGYLETEDNIQNALEQVQATKLKHIFAVLLDWKTVLGPAYDLGIVGHPDYSWITAEQTEWTADDFVLNRTTTTLEEGFLQDDFYDSQDEIEDNDEMPVELKWAHALHGMGQITLHVEDHPRFSDAMAEFANDNSTLRDEYSDAFYETELWQDLLWTTPDYNVWQAMNYDAAIAFGIAACQTPGLFTGPGLYQTLLNTGLEFEGVTGSVSFDPTTGTRSADSVTYRIDNLVLDLDESDSEYIRFDSRLAVLLAHGQVQEMHDFRYYGNTTAMPSALPTVHDHNYNLIPVGAQAFGWFLSAALIVMSLGWIVWVQQHQTAVIVQASQPVFLYQVCVGTLLMAAAIIPMGFQGTEPTMGLNTACMFIPWLVFVGFVVSLSALFSKAWRLNQIVKSGVQMRRVQVQVVDVIWPFVLLMTINVTLLTAWTIVAPLEYIRENDPHNVDMFGRHVESFGACKVNPDNSVSPLWFQIPIFLVNVATLGIATYQSYKSRHLPTEFSESSYLAISMASLLESLLLGGPILFVTLDNPTAFFVVGSGLLAVCCLCILLPVFIPKFQKRNEASLATTLRDSIVSASMRKMSSARGGLDSSLRSSHGFNATSSSNFSREFQQHPHQYSPPPSHGTRSAPVSADSWNVTTSQFSDDAQSHDSDIDISDTPKKREPWGRMSIKRTASDKPVTATSNGSSEKNRTSSNQSNRGSRAPSTLVSRSQCSSMPEIMEEDEIRDDNV